MSSEVWKEVPGYEGAYEVSDRGWVRSLSRRDNLGRRIKGGLLKPWAAKSGHKNVSLGRGNKHGVHCLVLTAFAGPCPAGAEACHYPDPNPANNQLCNLRWGTHAENCRDARRTGRAFVPPVKQGAKHPNSKLTDASARSMFQLRGAGWLLKDIATRFNVKKTTVSDILSGRSWKHLQLAGRNKKFPCGGELCA